MTESSISVVEALDRIREFLASSFPPGGRGGEGITFADFQYPAIQNGPVEEVLAFNNDEYIMLKNVPENLDPEALQSLPADELPYFSSHGPLTGLDGRVLRGSRVETTFPVDLPVLTQSEKWPPKQPHPYDQPPRDPTNTTGNGYSKQAYYFPDKDNPELVHSFVTVGPSLPKIARLQGGAAQFWVGSIGVIAQGTGRFKGARGVTTYVGSGYLKEWPEAFPDQAKVLADGFKALVGTYVKVVLRDSLAGGSRR